MASSPNNHYNPMRRPVTSSGYGNVPSDQALRNSGDRGSPTTGAAPYGALPTGTRAIAAMGSVNQSSQSISAGAGYTGLPVNPPAGQMPSGTVAVGVEGTLSGQPPPPVAGAKDVGSVSKQMDPYGDIEDVEQPVGLPGYAGGVVGGPSGGLPACEVGPNDADFPSLSDLQQELDEGSPFSNIGVPGYVNVGQSNHKPAAIPGYVDSTNPAFFEQLPKQGQGGNSGYNQRPTGRGLGPPERRSNSPKLNRRRGTGGYNQRPSGIGVSGGAGPQQVRRPQDSPVMLTRQSSVGPSSSLIESSGGGGGGGGGASAVQFPSVPSAPRPTVPSVPQVHPGRRFTSVTPTVAGPNRFESKSPVFTSHTAGPGLISNNVVVNGVNGNLQPGNMDHGGAPRHRRETVGAGPPDPGTRRRGTRSTPTGQFVCSVCGSRYENQLDLEAHRAVRHGAAQVSSLHRSSGGAEGSTQSPAKCPHCGRMYPSVEDVKQHVLLRHEGSDLAQQRCADCQRIRPMDSRGRPCCPDCAKLYPSGADLSHHRRIRHDSHCCPSCGSSA